jgi:hypothetical protein
MRGKYIVILLFTALLALAPTSSRAKDVTLGGDKKEPKNMVELPKISVVIQTEDGGWKHIVIDAWLAPKDISTVPELEKSKTAILKWVDHALPNHDFATLQSPEGGSAEAKKTIRAGTEATLGHPWKGDVLITTMLVY